MKTNRKLKANAKVATCLSAALALSFSAFTFGPAALAVEEGSDGSIIPAGPLRMEMNMRFLEREDAEAPITKEDLAKLTEIATPSSPVEDWSWLKYCTGLTSLSLGSSSFTDANLLKGLTNLESLILEETALKNVEAIGTLTNIKRLNLAELEADDEHEDEHDEGESAGSVRHLQALKTGRVTYRPMHAGHEEHRDLDVNFLSGLTELKDLSLHSNHLENAQVISNLKKLEKLDLSETLGAEKINFKQLTNLNSLYLKESEIKDTQKFSGLTKLQILHLEQNPLTNFAGLEKLTGLTELLLSGNQVTDYSPLAKLTGLTQLELQKNTVSGKPVDITPLAGLTNLKSLRLEKNAVADLTPLKNLTKLGGLSLDYGKFTDLEPISGLTSLQALSIGNNPQLNNDQLSHLGGLYNLQELRAANNKFSDLSGLQLDWRDAQTYSISRFDDQKVTLEMPKDAVEDGSLTRQVVLAAPYAGLTEGQLRLPDLENWTGVTYKASYDGAGELNGQPVLIFPTGFKVAEAKDKTVSFNTYYAGRFGWKFSGTLSLKVQGESDEDNENSGSVENGAGTGEHIQPGGEGVLPPVAPILPPVIVGPGAPNGEDSGYSGAGADADKIKRLGGADRVETAVKIWQQHPARTIVLAGKTGPADALVAAPLAASLHTSVLYTDRDQVNPAVAALVSRHQVEKAILAGGTGVISEQVAAQLKKMGLKVERLGGRDRFETSDQVTQRIAQETGKNVAEMPLVVVDGIKLADAIAAGPLATQLQGAVKLVNTGKPQVTKIGLPAAASVVFLGGAAPSKPAGNHTVITGADRYETASLVYGKYFSGHKAVIANGLQIADAALANSFGSIEKAGILLTKAQQLPAVSARHLHKNTRAYLIGGHGVISEAVEKQIAAHIE